MRGLWNLKQIVSCRRWPRSPMNWMVVCFVCVVVLVVVLNSPLPSTVSSSSVDLYGSYRRLREQASSDLQDIRAISASSIQSRQIEFCGRDRENFVPCYNVSANLLAGFRDGREFDRHCALERDPTPCLVRPPKDYKIPLRWPVGRDVIWSGNVKITKDLFFSSGTMTKRLMLLEENQIAFHSEDGAVFDGVKDYARQIAEMIGLASDSDFFQAGVRTVLDIGCGFGSFGAHLFSVKLITFCLAAYESYGSQVQLALERGLPAIIGSFFSQLPQPPLSYDMVHCAQCGLNWDEKDGAFLFEVDRVLKPGGYFVMTSPANKVQRSTVGERNIVLFRKTQEFASKICWSLLSQQDETFIWQKTTVAECYLSRKQPAVPLCKDNIDGGSYYSQLLPCIAGTTSPRWIPIQNKTHWLTGGQLSIAQLAIHGVHLDDLSEDSRFWTAALKNYWSLLTPLIFSDHPKRPGDEDPLPPFNMIRNVMDMSAHYGGLNAAFLEEKKSAWVMNVVPSGLPYTLPLIIDRGFTAVLHDWSAYNFYTDLSWCEPFPTYPRTYDMLHAMGLLSYLLGSRRCDVLGLLLEMDRILRPEGWVVLRDKANVIEKARNLVTLMHWDARIIQLQSDSGQLLLVCQKPFLKK